MADAKQYFESDNLKLNETCQRNEQCSVVFGSVCQNNTCGCRQGYVPFNDSECISLDILKNLCTSTKDCKDVSKRCSLTGKFGICVCKLGFIGFGNKCLKEDNIVNVIFGLGGLMLGAITTVLAETINHHIRKGKSKTKEKEHPGVNIVNNATLETEMDAVQNIPTVHCTNERNAQEAKKRSMTKKEENGDIYNHLHEKENDPDIDEENYDHAPGNLYNAMGDSNYSNLKE